MIKPCQSQIVSVSRRTDIPAFHASWFMERVREGYCDVTNPFNPAQVSRVSLKPQDVRAFVFWTRNVMPFLPYLDELDDRGYVYYFHYTLTGYPKLIEPGVPDAASAVEAFQQLSKRVGKARIIWRYDPIFFSDLVSVDWHQKQIVWLMEMLGSSTSRLVISFIDRYRHSVRRMKNAGMVLAESSFWPETYRDLAVFIAAEAGKKGVCVSSCAEDMDLSSVGILRGQCVDDALIGGISGVPGKAKKDKSQRPACGCCASKDIGTYGTCPAGCLYCYA